MLSRCADDESEDETPVAAPSKPVVVVKKKSQFADEDASDSDTKVFTLSSIFFEPS